MHSVHIFIHSHFYLDFTNVTTCTVITKSFLYCNPDSGKGEIIATSSKGAIFIYQSCKLYLILIS